jgi:hypothetical protein
MPEGNKFEVFQKIMNETQRQQWSLRKRVIFAKAFIYNAFLFILLAWLYGVHLWNNEQLSFWDQSQNWIENSVFADNVAKVMQFNGSFQIEHDWEYLQSSTIRNWDIITLEEESSMIFHINSGTSTEVSW